MALYAGLPTLVLAGIALVSRPRDPLARFFAAVALIALLLALGDATPLHGLAPLAARRPRLSRAGPLRAARGRVARRARGAGARLAPEGEAGAVPRRARLVLAPVAGLTPRPAPRGAALARTAGGGRLARCGLGQRRSRAARRPRLAPSALAGLDRGLALATAALSAGRRGGRRRAPCWWPPTSRPSPRRRFSTQWVRPDAVRSTRRGPRPRRLGRPWPRLHRERPRALAVGLGPAASSSGFAASTPTSRCPSRATPSTCAGSGCRTRRRTGSSMPPPSTSVVDSWRRPLDPRSTLGGEEFSPRSPLAGLGPGRQERERPLPPDGRGRGSGPARDLLFTTRAEILQDAEVARVTLEATDGAAPHVRGSGRAGRPRSGSTTRTSPTSSPRPT